MMKKPLPRQKNERSRRPLRRGGSQSSRSGFTLIEIILSISILALMMAVAWGSYASATSSQQRMQDINGRLHGVEQAMNRMVRELSMAFITSHGSEETQLEIRYKTGFYGENDRIDFTSMGYVRMFRDDKVGDQSEISYYVKRVRNDAGDLVPSLVRREDAPIDDDPQKGGTIMTLLENVESFRLEYWDDQKAGVSVGSDGWVDEWDSESADQAKRLPSRVKITIEIPNPRGSGNSTFTTQAEIHMIQSIDF